MLRKISTWMISYGLSIILSTLGIAEQGKAFIFLYLVLDVTNILVLALILPSIGAPNSISLTIVRVTAIAVAVMLLITWIVSKLFGINFYVTFEIITFFQCLFPTKND